jgi:hypothetical protein
MSVISGRILEGVRVETVHDFGEFTLKSIPRVVPVSTRAKGSVSGVTANPSHRHYVSGRTRRARWSQGMQAINQMASN